MSQAAVNELVARLSREGIHVSAVQRGEGVAVTAHGTAWSWPHTWLRIFQEFAVSGYGVKIS